jgi:hypothetical protein
MSLEATIYTALSSLVAGRCYPDVSPDGAAMPLIIYQQAGGKAVDFMEAKVPDKDNARVQVHVWSKTRLEASQIARAARVALVEGAAKASTQGAAVSLHDDALKLYGARQDYSVWYAP